MAKYLGPAPKFQAFDSSGDPLSAGKVYTYESGASTTPLATFTDSGGETQNANPVILDSRGEANIWFTPGVEYRVVLKTSADVTISTVDNVAGSVTPSAYFATLMTETSQSALFTDIVGPGGTVTGSFIMSGSTVEWAPGVTVASAASTPIGAAASNNVTVSGVTTITSFDNVTSGRFRAVTFSGALTLTHNATTLILPSAANITTAAGDVGLFQSLGSGNWKCLVFQRADGTAVVSGSTAATQAQMETATSTTLMVTPGRTQYHPGTAKAWLLYNGVSQTILASHNITSVTYNSVGYYTINIATDMSSANFAAIASANLTPHVSCNVSVESYAAGSVDVYVTNANAVANTAALSVVFFGDQA